MDWNEYQTQYQKEKYDEIKVRVPKGGKDPLKAQAVAENKTLNQYILDCIEEHELRKPLTVGTVLTSEKLAKWRDNLPYCVGLSPIGPDYTYKIITVNTDQNADHYLFDEEVPTNADVAEALAFAERHKNIRIELMDDGRFRVAERETPEHEAVREAIKKLTWKLSD